MDYTATLDTVEPVTIVSQCKTCGSFNNPRFNNLVGQTVLASTNLDDLFLGNFETDNEPIETADLRTTIGPGSFLGRYYTGSITRNIDDPEEANQISFCPNPACSAPTRRACVAGWSASATPMKSRNSI